jgi:hypothetical protein
LILVSISDIGIGIDENDDGASVLAWWVWLVAAKQRHKARPASLAPLEISACDGQYIMRIGLPTPLSSTTTVGVDFGLLGTVHA